MGSVTAQTTSAAPTAELDPETYRRELTAYCYRMLGSGFEAEDAVQETMVRAWRNMDSFEGRSSLRSWLYRIATNVCLDMHKAPQRRARPMDLGPSQSARAPIAAPTTEDVWVGPIADDKVLPTDGDPALLAEARDTIRLAFVAALQHLPPKQRAVLILREVLRWHADEVAALLETSVASVNSALQRARATLAEADLDASTTASDVADEHRELLASYVDAFERYDISSIVKLVHTEVVFNMPPYPMWLQGADEVASWLGGPGIECAGSRLLPTTANGNPAFGSYRIDPEGGHTPFALIVLEIADGRITGWHNFLDPELFPAFGLPRHLDPEPA